MEGFAQQPKTPETSVADSLVYALQTTLTKDAWEAFEQLSDMRLSHDEFLARIAEFNQLGEGQLDMAKLEGLGENLAERELSSVPMTLPQERQINISRSKRGVFTISA